MHVLHEAKGAELHVRQCGAMKGYFNRKSLKMKRRDEFLGASSIPGHKL